MLPSVRCPTLLLLFTGIMLGVGAGCRSADDTVAVGDDGLGGRVTGADGPEAGVWVIAETHDLPTRYAKMVVTDEEGRYLIPGLPDATYDLRVRRSEERRAGKER